MKRIHDLGLESECYRFALVFPVLPGRFNALSVLAPVWLIRELKALTICWSSTSRPRATANVGPYSPRYVPRETLLPETHRLTENRGVQEIIEFPVIQLETRTFRDVAQFHRYVRPEAHPVLTSFCTRLTGIVQEMVEGEEPLPSILDDFHTWLESRALLHDTASFAFVTCGDWDLRQQLPLQCRLAGRALPAYFKSWINIKMVRCRPHA